MIILLTMLLASSALADASAIKGQVARSIEEVKPVRLAAPVDAKTVQPVAPVKAPQVPVLESSKKVYNDESIRRLVAQAPSEPISVPVVKEPVLPVQPLEPVAAPAPVPVAAPAPVPVAAPAPVPVAAPAPVPVVLPVVSQVQQMAASPVVPALPPVPAVPADVSVSQVEAKSNVEPAVSAKLVEAKPVEVVKPVDDLPAQSERSAAPVSAPVPVPVAAPVPEPVSVAAPAPVPVAAPVSVAAPAPVPVAQVAPIVPAVPAASAAPAPVPEPSVVVPEPVRAAPVGGQPEASVVVPVDSSLQAKKEEVQPAPEPIEVPAPDPGLVLSEPIDSATKLLIDLDEHVQKFLPAEEQQAAAKDGVDQFEPASGKPVAPLKPYSSGADEHIVPPMPSLEGVEKASVGSPASPSAGSQPAHSQPAPAQGQSATRQSGHQHQNQQQVINQLLDQMESLQNRIQDTINQLVARRRYVMSALLRPMGTYVRRVRTNLERLQNRVNQLQAAAVSVGGGQNRPGGLVDAAAIETIRRRIDEISRRISDIVNRIRFSLTPTSAPLNNNGRK